MNKNRKESIVLKARSIATNNGMKLLLVVFIRFRRIQRKRKEKAEEKATETDTVDVLEKAERERAKERATLKHTRMSKWAKEQLARKHKDPVVRNREHTAHLYVCMCSYRVPALLLCTCSSVFN